MSTPLIIGAFALVALVGLVIFVLITDSGSEQEVSPYRYARKKFFMSRAEHECYDALLNAVGNEYLVFAQVHLPTIVNHKIEGQKWNAAFRHVSQKSVDFVLCDKKYISPVLAIELDDRTHEREDRKERDTEVERILTDAGMPLLRLRNQGSFDVRVLATSIRQALHS